MRSISRWMLAAALAVSTIACGDSSDNGGGNEQRVAIFFTTDEHSQLFAYAPEKDDFAGGGAVGTGELVGGVTRRLAILERERAAAQSAGKDVLTLSSGDFSQGSLASAAWLATSPELRLMKKMGYDAVALGNHEFDLGPAALAGAIGAAATAQELPPLLLTNLFFSATSPADDALAAMYGTEAGKLVAPWRVLTTGHGLKIGIVASMGVGAGTVAGAAPPVTFWSAAATTNQDKFLSIVAAVQGAVDQLRDVEKVDAVILLGHGGIGETGAPMGEDEQLAYLTHGIDLVLSGHSHLSTPTPRSGYSPTGPVTVVQPKPYGKEVGRIELVFRDDVAQRPYVDVAGATFLAVDDRTAPTADAAFTTELVQLTVGFLETGAPIPNYPSFLEQTLSRILGTPVTDDPAVVGDLYFHSIGKLDFDVVGVAPGETNAMNLDTDALLAAANEFHGAAPTLVAVQASGPIRGDLRVGETGDITFADVYHVVPLGGDPTVANPTTDPNAVPGYPLVRANIPTAELRGVLEQTLQFSFSNGDFFVSAAGLKVKYDVSRPAYDPTASQGVGPGWVTFMALENGATETVLYDPSNPAFAATAGFAGNPLTMVTPVATTLYVASFAASFGVHLLDDTGAPQSPLALVLRRPDGSAVKDYEALGKFVFEQCNANTPAGFLPSRYDATTPEGALPRRMINCTGGCP
jgi:5'-nucleotidase / UDP-sugar diphosphatase